jgi:molybdopterin-guanine dinucleotide biosynthesis protein A
MAIATGWLTLRESAVVTAALVIASDLPFVSESLLRFLVDYDAPGSIVPVVQGVAQPLCARWSADDLATSVQMVEEGERSLRRLLAQPGVVLLDHSHWGRVATVENFLDIDTPEEAQRCGVTF